MEDEDTKINSQSERRFSSIIFLLRLGGIPFQMKSISIIYALYLATLIFCGFTSYIGVLFDVYVHWDDFGHVMTNTRSLIVMTNSMWLYIYYR
jgi:hypothetical protein